ncbi:DEAD/DEAH box helicase family protein [Spiroplasma sp. BIUS-1]|uniref:DEAD/DEAH box helicase family protein n=1 Tax=Spiroplasma sp. BIUS-1 TaxID=216964 RepID=UPI001397A631|nr:DEAD/DEAH box helicase family protein [Spiroplasma sp. BIUS-1]QHX36760.1 type III restriction enzyme [Spiroplasma sp. BIUS-1]
MILTNSQENAVNNIFNEYKSKTKVVSFKAPTGSGKTFMAANIISKIMLENQMNEKKKLFFVIATLSDADLPRAFAKKMEYYKKFLPFKNFEVEHRVSPSSKNNKIEAIQPFSLEENKVLIFGTSSFGNKKLFSEEGILDNFIQEIKQNKEWKLIYIRDEAHKGSRKLNSTDIKVSKDIDSNIRSSSSFVLEMTATPLGNNKIIELKAEQMKEDGLSLLKEKAVLPNEDEFDLEDEFILKAAIKKFKETVKVEYKKLEEDGVYIRPAMLIQVSSTNSKNENFFKENISKIISILEKENLNWLKYFSDDKSSGVKNNIKVPATLEEASKNDSLYDVIIFKVGPATGWDIPRACMLVQLRNVFSENLNIQTLGRIKRNPYPNLLKNPITDKYYLYSNYQESSRNLEGYKIKEKFENKLFFQGRIKNKENNRTIIVNHYSMLFEKMLRDEELGIKNLCISNMSKKSIDDIWNKETIVSEENLTIKYPQIKDRVNLKINVIKTIKKNLLLYPETVVKIINSYAQENNLNFDFLFYTIHRNFIDLLKNNLSNSFIVNRKMEDYIVDEKIEPQKYYKIWVDKSENPKKIENLEKWENYGYELISGIEKEKNIQFLDSGPEEKFMKDFFNELSTIKNYLEKEIYFNFFAKMPTFGSNLYFEYFNEKEQNYSKSYIDFLIESQSGNLIMVEVKSYDDYDEVKTSNLLNGYEMYMKQNDDSKIELCVCFSGRKIGNEDKETTFKYYNRNLNKFDTISLSDFIKKTLI